MRTSDGVSVISVHFQLIVDDTGIEPVTPTMSMWCSTAEPIVLGVRTIHQSFNVSNHPQYAQYHLLQSSFLFEPQ